MKNSAPADRRVAKTGSVAIPHGRDSSRVTHKALGNDMKPNNKPMTRGR